MGKSTTEPRTDSGSCSLHLSASASLGGGAHREGVSDGKGAQEADLVEGVGL